jgi:hypothetical protein
MSIYDPMTLAARISGMFAQQLGVSPDGHEAAPSLPSFQRVIPGLNLTLGATGMVLSCGASVRSRFGVRPGIDTFTGSGGLMLARCFQVPELPGSIREPLHQHVWRFARFFEPEA